MESRPRDTSSQKSTARADLLPPAPPECASEMTAYRSTVAANDTRMSQLVRTIEQEIIPRLMLAHRTTVEPIAPAGLSNYAISTDDVHRFAKLVLSQDEDIAFATVQKLRALDVSVEKIYVDLLAPTARHLGTLWEDDRCSFTDVTVGLGRLQRVLREFGPALGQSVGHPQDGRRVLLLPCAGEQHTFGLVMVAEFFRRDGWDVVGGAWSEGADAAALAKVEWFDVVGFSLGAAIHLDRLKADIAAVRHAACNRDLKVLVGGPLFSEHPDYALQVGADAMTVDGREAPALAEALIAGPASAEAVSG